MALDDCVRRVDSARNELIKVADLSAGWSDRQRHEFDKNRMEPLEQAAANLRQALRKAGEQCEVAQKLLR